MKLMVKIISRLRNQMARRRLRSVLTATLEVRQPRRWEELTDNEAWMIFDFMTHKTLEVADLPVLAFMSINGLGVIARNAGGKWLCTQKDGPLFEINAATLARLAAPLQFLLQPPKSPWRPGAWRGGVALDADLPDLSFADWLVVENTLQGVLATRDMELLDDLRPMLVRRRRLAPALKCSKAERVALYNWLLSVKEMIGRRFPNLYQSASGSEAIPDALTIQRGVDAQVRALTKGDITKENEVMEMNMYRALTELDAQAREYAEMKRS